MRVMTIVGTRPEVIRLSRVITRLDSAFEHILVHTGQNYDFRLNGIFFDELQLRGPDEYLGVPTSSLGSTIGGVIEKSFEVLEKYNPDALLVLGDTNSCLSAYSAKRLKIPIFHMEAGNRCFDQNVPEEINRKIIDHLADINLPYSDIARDYLLRENFPPDRIVKTGSPMPEILKYYEANINESGILDKLSLDDQCYFVVSIHREENLNSEGKIKSALELLGWLADQFDKCVVVSLHPRTKREIESVPDAVRALPKAVKLSEPFGFFDYCKLQKHSFCTLSDSGTVHEEACALGFNAINLRSSNERPEAMEQSIVPMIPIDLLSHIELFLGNMVTGQRALRVRDSVADYQSLEVSDRVTETLISYTPYIQRTVWGQ